MEQYIKKSAFVAEIERRMKENFLKAKKGSLFTFDFYEEDKIILSIINEFKSEDFDLEKETKRWWEKHLYLNPDNQLWMDAHQSITFAKHFFELGMRTANPTTVEDRSMAEEIIVNLKRVENDYHIDLTKQMEWLRNIVKKVE